MPYMGLRLRCDLHWALEPMRLRGMGRQEAKQRAGGGDTEAVRI